MIQFEPIEPASLDPPTPSQIRVTVEQRPDSTSICYEGSEDGLFAVTSSIERLPRPRDPAADTLVRLVAISATLIGVLYLTHSVLLAPQPIRGIHYVQ